MSYYVNYIKGGEYRTASPAGLMVAPYARVFILHITIILGSMAVFVLGQPIYLLVLLVVLKTILDVILHIRSHRRIREGPASTVPPGPTGWIER